MVNSYHPATPAASGEMNMVTAVMPDERITAIHGARYLRLVFNFNDPAKWMECHWEVFNSDGESIACFLPSGVTYER